MKCVGRFWQVAGTLLAVVLSSPAAPAADAVGGSDHWAFQPIGRVEVPLVRNEDRLRSPIDAFIWEQLRRQGIEPAAEASREVLLRRVYLDLLGIPPTPHEQRAFAEDTAGEAWSRLVDRLLIRPEYGERWSRHWLDVVRYAESNGYERDGTKPNAWRFRDYVIRALNSDKSYRRFLVEQLAGDEIEGSNAESQIATTFLRLGTWDDEPVDPTADRYDQLDDVLGTTATVFLGVTLRCARCHDHKFEPFSQEDYYRVLAVFNPLKRPEKIKSATHREEFDRMVGTKAELAAYREAVKRADGRVAELKRQLAGLKDAARKKELEAQIKQVEADRPAALPMAYIWYEDTTKAPETRLFKRGDSYSPLQVIAPAIPSVLLNKPVAGPKQTANSTGRRLWLARWMTDRTNPLVARVFVNRVWQHHFGEGLVTTESNFGEMGDVPVHQRLIDWLAADFMDSGWQIKRLHRLIVCSSTYRLSSRYDPRSAAADPSERLLWRWRHRRLDAEVVRDSALAVSGQANRRMHGPSIYPELPKAVLAGQSRPGSGWGKSDRWEQSRRSVYIFSKRSLAVPELDLLDAPKSSDSCEQRAVSTTGPQALTFLNGAFMNGQAAAMAVRVTSEAGDRPRDQIERIFRLALCRPPASDEVAASLAFLESQAARLSSESNAKSRAGIDPDLAKSFHRRALTALCLVILNTNEFTYTP